MTSTMTTEIGTYAYEGEEGGEGHVAAVRAFDEAFYRIANEWQYMDDNDLAWHNAHTDGVSCVDAFYAKDKNGENVAIFPNDYGYLVLMCNTGEIVQVGNGTEALALIDAIA